MRISSPRARQRIIIEVAKAASGLISIDDMELPTVNRFVVEAAKNVSLQLRHMIGNERILYCTICGQGPFRPRGYYLHLRRVHPVEIVAMVEDEAERLLASSHS